MASEQGRLAGRRIVITGGGSGIGAASALRFVKEGARVAILGQSLDKLDAVAGECGATPIAVDLRDPAATGAAMDTAADALGGIDGLVCNAGVGLSRPFAETTIEEWHLAIDGNATSVFLSCQAALQHLQRNDAATIVTTGSAVALQPLRGRAAYSASKAAAHAFTKVLAVELAPRIRCNTVAPGAVLTPLSAEVLTDPEAIGRVSARYALERLGESEEIAEAILFLTSHESSFVTGSILAIDGGRVFY